MLQLTTSGNVPTRGKTICSHDHAGDVSAQSARVLRWAMFQPRVPECSDGRCFSPWHVTPP
eukprot:3184684-Lingulodinium_polyedra.AAC.1